MKKIVIVGFVLVVLVGSGLTFWLTNNKKQNSNTQTGSPSVQAATDTKKEIAFDEVVKHANQNDCWMVIDGKVYDITQFIPRHPGGRVIIEGCGRDATELFNTHGIPGGQMHSALAKRILASYQIGVLSNK